MKDFYTIDIGNSHPHLAHFHQGEIQTVQALTSASQLQNVEHGLASVVGKVSEEFSVMIKKFSHLPKLKDGHFFEMPVHYSETLGQDRLVCAYLIYQQSPGPTLLIDAGTFVTVDLLSHKGFLGGHILPGLQVLTSCYQRGDQLPVIGLNEFNIQELDKLNQLPHSTEEAITKTTLLMYRDFLTAFIERHKPQQIILTGGSAKTISALLPENLPKQDHPHLIHEALYLIGKKLF